MNKFEVGQQGISLDGQHVTIVEVYSNGLLVKATTGAVFTIKFNEFKETK